MSELAGSAPGSHGHDDPRSSEELSQEDKPRSRIVAEYLAHGYTISDAALQRAIALDNKHGVSNRFTNALTAFDNKVKATDRARGIDETYKISDKTGQAWSGLSSYFEKALQTPTGQRVAAFYTQSDKQVRDIHAEARRLADLKSGKSSSSSSSGGGAVGGSLAENEKSMEKVQGTEKTTCQCGGNMGTCPCAEGKCACSGCAKAGHAGGEKSATGNADQVAQDTGVQPLGEKS